MRPPTIWAIYAWRHPPAAPRALVQVALVVASAESPFFADATKAAAGGADRAGANGTDGAERPTTFGWQGQEGRWDGYSDIGTGAAD
jgi:hypothetical protein